MYRKQRVLDLGGYDEEDRVGEDMHLVIKAVGKSYGVENLPMPLVYWRDHSASLTGSNARSASPATISRWLSEAGLPALAGAGQAW